LAIDPRSPELLAMKAAIRFLADDKPGMEAALKATFEQNPEFARAYHIIAEFAEWEHRYAEIVEMMKKASKLDPQEGSFLVNLGLNQIRIGAEADGVASLNLGFRKDKFNVRAYNTLNLYERDIPQHYESEKVGTRFLVRYPKNEKKVLERYVPRFLDDAWGDMKKRYGFEPTTPIGVELYGNREHFSVRTSGLPNVGIQGVCFGETLAAISPKAEPFNWGMVVWHEVGHVFAIQQSKNHVPRWFTEGLSEYETILRRPEWSREEDQALYLALRRGKVPAVEQMNRAFTHAEDARDMTTAYYASSQIVVFFAEKFGMPKLVAMLKAWGEGKRTPEVLRSALGVSGDEIDRQFRAWLDQRLVRYKKQYLPDLRAKPLEVAEKEAQAQPGSAAAQVQLALARLASGDGKGAFAALDAAQKVEPKNPDARYLRARVALQRKKPDEARKELETMVAEGNDGYAVRMLLGDIAGRGKDLKTAAAHFEAASNLDPTQAEPLQALADMARKDKDEDRELAILRKLAPIDQHDRRVWRRLLARLVARGLWDEAKKVGEGALYVDIHGAETHALYAQALLGAGDADRAIFEAESALLCEPLKERTAAEANLALARAYLKKGDRVKAKAARDEALRQDPENKDARSLTIPLPEHGAGDDGALDLAGSLVDGGHAHVAEVALDGEFTGVAIAPVDLHRPVADPVGGLAGEELGHARLPGEGLPRLLERGGPQRQEPGGVQLGGTVGEHPLDRLELRDGFVELPPVPGVADGGVEGRLCDAAGLAGDADAPAVEGHHGDLEAPAGLAQQRVVGDEAALEGERDRVRRPEPHLVLRAPGLHPLGAPLHQEAGDPAGPCPAGARPHDEHPRVGPGGDPLLLAVEEVAPVDPGGGGAHPAGIAAGSGLAQREGPRRVAPRRQRRDVPPPLRFRPEGRDHLPDHVGHRHRHRRGRAGGGDLHHRQRVGHHPRLRAAQLFRQVDPHQPQPGHLPELLRRELPLPVELRRDRPQAPLGVVPGHLLHHPLGFVRREIHPHGMLQVPPDRKGPGAGRAPAAGGLCCGPVTPHPPRFEQPVDLDAHLRRLPPGARCRGLFFAAPLAQLRKTKPTHPLLTHGLGAQRYTPFLEYPYADFLRLLVEVAPAVFPGVSPGEGLRRLGRGGYEALLGSQVGQVVFGIFGRDFERVVQMGARGYEVSLNFGSLQVERVGPRCARYHYRRRPIFLETYQVGIIEGAMRTCGVEGEVLVHLDSIEEGTLEIRWA
jgi:uncharacterized protein (TIGR02265 family)